MFSPSSSSTKEPLLQQPVTPPTVPRPSGAAASPGGAAASPGGAAASPGGAAASPGGAAASPGGAAASPGGAAASPGAVSIFGTIIGTADNELEQAIIDAFQREPLSTLSIDNSTYDSTCYNFFRKLKKNKEILKLLNRVSSNLDDEERRDLIILSILDQIFYNKNNIYTNFEISQFTTLLSILNQELQTIKSKSWLKRVFDSDNSDKERIKFLEGKIKNITEQKEESEEKKKSLKEKTFSNIIFSYKRREFLLIQLLRQHDSSINSFCGTATSPVTPRGRVSEGILDPPSLNFELEIHGTGEVSSNSSLVLEVYNDELNYANIINALLKFKGILDVPDTNGAIVTSLNPKPTACSTCGSCGILGGAKKIKRARQSKKKKARRSKSKSKRVRRKNKLHRN